MMLLALGFIVFCIGGTFFQKGGVDRVPGQVLAVSLGARVLTTAGITLMAAGGLLMIGSGI